MQTPIIVALVAATVAISGWFVTSYLSRRTSDRERGIKRKESQEALIREIIAACHTRAVYTRAHAQLDWNAMLRALAKCRSTLQSDLAKIDRQDQQQLVASVISDLDSIERHPDDFDQINILKRRIIWAVKKLADSANLKYTLPASTTEEVFFSIEDAMAIPAGDESPHA